MSKFAELVGSLANGGTMNSAVGISLPVRCRPRRSRCRRWALALFLPALMPVTATAQGSREPESVSAEQIAGPVCIVQVRESFGDAIGSARPAAANCRGYGVFLGYADTFEVISNDRLDAVLVDLREGSDRRIRLISMQSDGRPLLEDLNGEIALAAGRGPMSDVNGIEIDTGRFAADGVIVVQSLEDRGAGKAATTTQISVSDGIASERARREAVTAD